VSDLLRLAWAGVNPERVRRWLGEQGDPGGVVAAILAGRVEVPAGAVEAVAVGAAERSAALAALGVSFVERGSPAYPARLAGLPDAPPWLFVRGDLPAGPGVAVVGSRRASRYGLEVAERLGAAVGAAGWPVVSGLAAGVDGAAHQGCLEGGGVGVAVLGSGIDVWYPAAHRGLGERLLGSGGAVVSEFPPGTPPEPWRFPCRNRIVSGLAEAVVVVEAAVRSGALITARLALEQGAEVLAVPGDIDRPTAVGANLLLRDGAHPVLSAEDLVATLELALGPAPRAPAAPGPEGPAWAGPVGVPLDEAAAASGLDPAAFLAEVARLEAAGRVVVDAGLVRRR
jgi:DNA processing protein